MTTWTCDFFENDAQFVFEKGAWIYWLHGARVSYLPLADDHGYDENDDEGATQFTLMYAPSLLWAPTAPFLKKTKPLGLHHGQLKPGALILLIISGFPEMMFWMLDCLLCALVEALCALSAHIYYRYQPCSLELIDRQKSCCLGLVVLKCAISFYCLILPIKWLWRWAAIEMPSWGLTQHRLGFIIGAGSTLCFIIIVLFFSGSVPPLLFLPVIVKCAASFFCGMSTALNTASLWIATHWFLGVAWWIAPLVQGVLSTVLFAGLISTIGNITAYIASCIHAGINAIMCGALDRWIARIDKRIDQAIPEHFLYERDEEPVDNVLSREPKMGLMHERFLKPGKLPF